jgi:seryl-tRNA synthetase
MKYLFIIFLFGCTVSAQKTSEEVEQEREFNQLMSRVAETNNRSVEVQQAASKKEAELVTKAVSTIVAMKSEIKDLKIELNEVKSKLDSVTIDTGSKFMLLPISNN